MSRDFSDAVGPIKDLNRGVVNAGAQSFRGVRIGKCREFWTKQPDLLREFLIAPTSGESDNRESVWKSGDNVKRIVAYGSG